MNFWRNLRFGWLMALLVLGGCAKNDSGVAADATGSTMPTCAQPIIVATGTAVRPATDFFTLTVGGRAARVQLAVTLDEMQRGLMGRRDLGPDDGMIFIYPAPQRMSFWMRNTPTPLDIGFFTADGRLGEVYPMYPYDETPVQSVGTDYTLALEMNQGWFARHGIKPGARLDLRELAAALAARGFEPRRYGVVTP